MATPIHASSVRVQLQTFEYVITYNILLVVDRELTEQMLVMVVVMMNELAQQVLLVRQVNSFPRPKKIIRPRNTHLGRLAVISMRYYGRLLARSLFA